jgi:hypothetical protein
MYIFSKFVTDHIFLQNRDKLNIYKKFPVGQTSLGWLSWPPRQRPNWPATRRKFTQSSDFSCRARGWGSRHQQKTFLEGRQREHLLSTPWRTHHFNPVLVNAPIADRPPTTLDSTLPLLRPPEHAARRAHGGSHSPPAAAGVLVLVASSSSPSVALS